MITSDTLSAINKNNYSWRNKNTYEISVRGRRKKNGGKIFFPPCLTRSSFFPPLLQRILDRQLSPPHFCEILARSKASKLGNFEKLCGIFKEQRGKKNVEARNIKRQVTRTYMQAVPTHTSLLFLFIFISFYWYIAHAEEKTVIHLFFLSRRYTSFFILSLDHRKVI